MPFRALKEKERSRVAIEIQGPRTRKEQVAFRTALNRLLRKNRAKILKRPGGGR